ncbi:helix-turn-helix domain-containing protein [Bradyrhizobium sp. WSM471]|uniref:helix-turn-helix domain-containing protein n=1 Tax=Bradyrhizobium sp. WSM471 TaxID=319017 RepID=UPI00024D2131|nr:MULTISPECIES: helix-turn-helix domain-containing protein [Bradyrhizobium]EHR01307.1 Transposase [Bradyrhizobium sp. WSM471]UFW43368.1 helix-turn-helix domain-containing protein [Bradyrhizobium canariense]
MKKHSRHEIFLKLNQADALVQAGSSQVQISKALGVSVMTLHRWRRLPRRPGEFQSGEDAVQMEALGPEGQPSAEHMHRLVEELTLENRRLRKIVTDLLLEKLQLEEGSSPGIAHKDERAS